MSSTDPKETKVVVTESVLELQFCRIELRMVLAIAVINGLFFAATLLL